MQRFYFHVRNDVVVDDAEGMEFADQANARRYALAAVRDLICASVHEHGRLNLDHHVDVADDTGTLFTVTFRDAVEVIGR